MSSLRKKTKLSVRNPTSKSDSTKNTNICMREDTLFRKASQLAKLCAIDVCIIYFRHNGELKIWPEEPKVREMAEKYMKLSDKERMKKSTNTFVISKNKMLLQDNKFSEKKVTEMEDSLISHLQILEPEFFGVDNLQAEPDQNPVVPFATNISNGQQHLMSHMTSGFTSDISPSVFTHPHQQPQFMNCVTSGTEQDESESPVIIYNHDNSSYSQVPPNSVSRFDPLPLPSYDDMMSMARQFGSNNYIESLHWNNPSMIQQFGLRRNNIDLLPRQMQTQSPVDQFASWSYSDNIFSGQ